MYYIYVYIHIHIYIYIHIYAHKKVGPRQQEIAKMREHITEMDEELSRYYSTTLSPYP
jgi:hypothetical protein